MSVQAVAALRDGHPDGACHAETAGPAPRGHHQPATTSARLTRRPALRHALRPALRRDPRLVRDGARQRRATAVTLQPSTPGPAWSRVDANGPGQAAREDLRPPAARASGPARPRPRGSSTSRAVRLSSRSTLAATSSDSGRRTSSAGRTPPRSRRARRSSRRRRSRSASGAASPISRPFCVLAELHRDADEQQPDEDRRPRVPDSFPVTSASVIPPAANRSPIRSVVSSESTALTVGSSSTAART